MRDELIEIRLSQLIKNEKKAQYDTVKCIVRDLVWWVKQHTKKYGDGEVVPTDELLDALQLLKEVWK